MNPIFFKISLFLNIKNKTNPEIVMPMKKEYFTIKKSSLAVKPIENIPTNIRINKIIEIIQIINIFNIFPLVCTV